MGCFAASLRIQGKGHLLGLTGCANLFWLIFSDNRVEEQLVGHSVLSIHRKKYAFPLRRPSVNINKEWWGVGRITWQEALTFPLTRVKRSSRKESGCKVYASSSPESGGPGTGIRHSLLSCGKQTPPLVSASSSASGLCLGKGCTVGKYRAVRGSLWHADKASRFTLDLTLSFTEGYY